MATEKVKVYEETEKRKGVPSWVWLLPLLLLLAMGIWFFNRPHDNNGTTATAVPASDAPKPDTSPRTQTAQNWTAASIADTIQQHGRVSFNDSEVHFATASATLAGDSQVVLDQVAQALKNHSDWKMRIVGHADATGSEAANNTLSKQRAQSVIAYLTHHGVDSLRLRIEAAGEHQPAATNATDTGRAENRRVELVKD